MPGRVARSLLIAAVGAFAVATPALTQVQTGNLFLEVTDTDGNPLPGATATLSGMGPNRIQISNAQGHGRFLGLEPGGYKATISLDGFNTVEYPNVRISVGRTRSLEVRLSPAVDETISVTSESPLLDSRKISTGTTVTQVELDKIPTARDPWVILQQTPGVLTDRINVGGNESGQQSQYTGPGSTRDDHVFAVDGVVITDMAAIGASPSYYNFDAFEEMQATTGGTDVQLATSGVTLNMVTRRGTNEWRGSGRYFIADNSSAFADQGDLASGQTSFRSSELDKNEEAGFEFGGPFIMKDKLWIWGSYSENEIRNFVFDGTRAAQGTVEDFTELEYFATKLNGQITDSNSFIGYWNSGDKFKTGDGAGPDRPRETTWNQTGPTDIYKLEDTHVFSSNFYLTGMASYVGGGFQFTPQGGRDTATRLDGEAIWRNSFLAGDSDRDSELWKIDGSYFFNTGNTNHELKFGTAYRSFEVNSVFSWPGNTINIDGLNFGSDFANDNFFAATQQGSIGTEADYTSVYVQDTLTSGNFTINIGLRYDLQDGTNSQSSFPANPNFSSLLPAQSVPGNDGGGFEWETIAPRVGLTYALGADRKTLLRASYSQFAQQLGAQDVNRLTPGLPNYGYFFFYDLNGDNSWQTSEPRDFIGIGPGFSSTASPPTISNRTDPGLDPAITDEILLGVEHAFLPEFVVGASFTTRQTTDLSDEIPLAKNLMNGNIRPVTRNDYFLNGTISGTLPNGDPYTTPFFSLNEGFALTGGSFLTNTDREQDYQGISLTFNKRLANRWMLRGHFNWADWEWNVPDSAIFDPNPSLESPREGDPFLLKSPDSNAKDNVFIDGSSWSFNIAGLYQVAPDRPWGFNVGANCFGREGYPIPYTATAFTADGEERENLAVDRTDQFKLDDIQVLDLRVDKDFEFGDFGFNVSLDAFNVFDENYVLQRQRSLNGSRPDFVEETLSPRVFRLGVRLNWR